MKKEPVSSVQQNFSASEQCAIVFETRFTQFHKRLIILRFNYKKWNELNWYLQAVPFTFTA